MSKETNKGCQFCRPRGRYAPEGDEHYQRGVRWAGGATVCDDCATRIERGDPANPGLYLDPRSNQIRQLPWVLDVPAQDFDAFKLTKEAEGWKVEEKGVTVDTAGKRKTTSKHVHLTRDVG